MTSTIIIGAGGHARSLLGSCSFAGLVQAVDDDERRHGLMVWGATVIGGREKIKKADGLALVNGIGNRAKTGDSGLGYRMDAFLYFKMSGFDFPPVFAQSAVGYNLASIGDGAQFLNGVVVNPGAVIGMNTIINTRAVIEHGVHVGAHSHVAPGAIVCGNARIGNAVHVGAGAVVLQGITIGDGAVIGAGAVVTRDVAPRATVVGNPGRVVG